MVKYLYSVRKYSTQFVKFVFTTSEAIKNKSVNTVFIKSSGKGRSSTNVYIYQNFNGGQRGRFRENKSLYGSLES